MTESDINTLAAQALARLGQLYLEQERLDQERTDLKTYLRTLESLLKRMSDV